MTVKVQKTILGVPVPLTKRDVPQLQIFPLEWVAGEVLDHRVRSLQVFQPDTLMYSSYGHPLDRIKFTRDEKITHAEMVTGALIGSRINALGIRSSGLIARDRYSWEQSSEQTLPSQARK